MRITTIPQIFYRNIGRWREIIGVLGKYGLGGWLASLELPFAGALLRDRDGHSIGRRSREERIRMAMEELGPTFIKLGQILSTRPDLVGVPLADELSKLQCGVPADPFARVRELLESELERPLEECFSEFSEQPIASASIGQVHWACLPDGRVVAVKVQHAGIEDQVRVDTDILLGLAELAEGRPEFANYRPVAIAREFQRTIRRELDFFDELRRMEQLAECFKEDPRIRIPAAFPELSTRRVLVMDWLEGEKISDAVARKRNAEELATIARNGADVFLEMVFDHGLYHADPHPGNLLLMPDAVLGILDFGMVVRISDSLREDLEDMLLAVLNDDSSHLTSVVMRVGQTPRNLDRESLTNDIADFVDRYGHQPIECFDLTGALRELVEITRRYRVVLPTSLAMLLKLFIMLEGTGRQLAPEFSLLQALAPYRTQMILQRFSPMRQAKKARRIYTELEQLAEIMPRRMREILQQIETGKFDVHLDHRGLDSSVNRLVLGMLTSALFLGSSLMVSRNVWPILGVSTPGAFGFFLSAILGLTVMRAITKSGKHDRRP